MAAISGMAIGILVSADLLSLGRNFLLHAFGADFDIQVLLETASHRFERAYLLREHRGVCRGITPSYEKLGRRERRGLL